MPSVYIPSAQTFYLHLTSRTRMRMTYEYTCPSASQILCSTIRSANLSLLAFDADLRTHAAIELRKFDEDVEGD